MGKYPAFDARPFINLDDRLRTLTYLSLLTDPTVSESDRIVTKSLKASGRSRKKSHAV